jgi:hypothetical protein
MQLVEVDHVDAEALQGSVARRPDLVRPEPRAAVGGGDLRGHHQLVAPPGDRLADDPLRHARAVDLGGVDPGDPGVERGMVGAHDVVVVWICSPRVATSLPRAEADHRDVRAVGPKSSSSHVEIQPRPQQACPCAVRCVSDGNVPDSMRRDPPAGT